MKEPGTILVATALRKECNAALEYAIRLADFLNTEITILHVVEQVSFIADELMKIEMQQHIVDAAMEKISNTAKQAVGNRSVKYTILVKWGNVHKIIPEVARETEAGFVCMGRSETPDIGKNLFGTNARLIVNKSNIPVITLKEIGNETRFGHILLPLDLTKPTREKISEAVYIARLFKSRITAITILEKNWISEKIKFTTRLHKIQEIFQKYGIVCQYEILEKSNRKVSDCIIDSGMKRNVDLILMMTAAETDMHDLFIGSTTAAVIRNTELPVLTFIPGAGSIKSLPAADLQAIIDPIGIFKAE